MLGWRSLPRARVSICRTRSRVMPSSRHTGTTRGGLGWVFALALVGLAACTAASPPSGSQRPAPRPTPPPTEHDSTLPEGQGDASRQQQRTPPVRRKPATYPVPQDGHDGSVWTSAWSPSGEFLATGGFDHTVRLWDREGRLWIVLRGHGEAIKRVVFSPDGEQLATSSRDGTIRIWDLRTGRTRVVLEDAGWDVDWSPDGSTLVTVGPGPRSDSAIRLWRASDGELAAEVEASVPNVRQLLSVAYASDGATIGAAGNGRPVQI